MTAMTDHRLGKLLVTGAPGWLTDAFLQRLANDPLPGLTGVRCFLHHATNVGPNEPAQRWGMDAEIVRGDLTDAASLERAVQGVDTVLHAAAIIHVRHIRDYYEVNTQGTRRLAEAAARAGVKRFVYVSSNAAAGRSEGREHTLREADGEKPLSHYGRSKYLAEKWLFDTPGAMERVALRPCMFYGPPVPPRHVEVYRRIMHGRMPLVGGGGYARSCVYIDNLVDCVRLALTKSKAAGQVYYVADREPYTTRQVVEAMAHALEVEPRFLKLPGFVADLAFQADTLLSMFGVYHQTAHLVGEANWNVGVSIEKARVELGYDPKVAIDDGMRAAVAWCRERRFL